MDEEKSLSEELLALVEQSGVTVFHSPEGDAYAEIDTGEHTEVYALNAKAFRVWLSHISWEANSKLPSYGTVHEVLAVLEGRAIHDGPECAVAVRVAEEGDTIWLDLADQERRAVKITAEGWEIGHSPPIKFIRPRGMLALPEPVLDGSLFELRRFINISDGYDWILYRAWLLGAMRPNRPSPILNLDGEQGSAKTTSGKITRSLIDPNTAPLRRPPKNDRDFMISAVNNRIIAYDNLSQIAPALAD